MSDNRRNHYRLLQVQPGAPVEIIRASYRTLMQRLKAHPDLGGDTEQAALINQAYDVLTDARKRAEYDRSFYAHMSAGRSAHAARAAHAGVPAVADGERCVFCGSGQDPRLGNAGHSLCDVCRSPLRATSRPQLAADGKRAINRLPRKEPLTLITSWPPSRDIPAQSQDISPNGIGFTTRERLNEGNVVKLEGATCSSVATVANVRDIGDGRYAVGAAFLGVQFRQTRGGFLSVRA